MATSQPKLLQQNFRETGKFKPISDHPQSPTDTSSITFQIQHSQRSIDPNPNPKKKNPLLPSQPRHLKISQRVPTNRKESSLVPSQIDYPVSVKDEKEKDNPYFDEFQNLLYEEEGSEEKQLALNDSFQEFQKRQHSEKNLQIIKELNKRKEKETQEKKMLDLLKDRIKELIAEEKEWINKNLKLKSDIKRLKTPETPEQNREIDEIKAKIGELKGQQKTLMQELTDIRKNNCIETLVYGQGTKDSSQSQRGKEKIFHSINNMAVPSNFNPLTTSVRSNTGISKFPQPNLVSQLSSPEVGNVPYTSSLKANRPNFPNFPSLNPIHLYSSIPTQSIIQQNGPQLKPSQSNGSDYTYHPRANPHNHQNSVPFTSAIFGSGRVCMGSPMGAKKPSVPALGSNSNKK